MTPIIKWAGGKRQLLPIITNMMPKKYNIYYEPFFGGGAVFFSLDPQKAVINDFNLQLVNMYRSVKEKPDTVKRYLDEFQKKYNALPDDSAKCDYYYELRQEFNRKICKNKKDAKAAALLIFMNKSGFNGLYRVNHSGQYNVPPAHKKNLTLYDKNNLYEVSKALSHADIMCGDFADSLRNVKSGDFVFIDSPYYDTFDSYQAGGFSEQDHLRLASLFKDMTDAGVKCMLTNSNTDFVRDLYKDYHIRTVEVKRMINSDASKRTGKEIIVTNYDNGEVIDE